MNVIDSFGYGHEPLPAFDNSGKGPLHVPGFGIPLDYEIPRDYRSPKAFAHGIKEGFAPRLLVRELAMLQLMDAITDKPSWHVKIFDEIIVERWHAEATAMPLVSEHVWDWCLQELREKAKAYADKHYVLTYDSYAPIAKSDELLSRELRDELILATRPLLNVPPAAKDWHPGTDEKVLNLVHPSLYPLVYGQTRVLSRGGRVDLRNMAASLDEKLSDVAPVQASAGQNWALSSRFQWLPCDVEFSGPPGSTDVRITSYVNNLHPDKHKPLYGILEKLIGLAIPLWNDVLVFGTDGRTPCRIMTRGTKYDTPEPLWCSPKPDIPSSVHDENFAEFWAKVEAYLAQPDRDGPDRDQDEWEDPLENFENEAFAGEEENANDMASDAGSEDLRTHMADRLLRKLKRFEDPKYTSYLSFENCINVCIDEKWRRIRSTLHPEPGVATTYENWKKGQLAFDVVSSYGHDYIPTPHDRYDVSLQDKFRDSGLQVIVKLASIELTPEKPEYAGGSWHLEGMLNEHIVATALFYYDVENVSDSRLAFRQEASLDEELDYEQSVHDPLCTIFGTDSMQHEPAVQALGSVLTNPAGPEADRTCRVLAFSNTLQHSVAPFSLVDRTKPGHRRFAVLWLVDPHYRVCSTANVPPQRHDWSVQENIRQLAYATPTLPPELLNMVREEVKDYPMGRAEAERLRLELMAERTRLMPHVETHFDTYNLCEH